MSDHYLNEAVVVGIYIDRSLNDFIRACEIYIQAEQEKVMNPTAEAGGLALGVRRTVRPWLSKGQGPEPSAILCRVIAGVPGGFDVS